MVSEGVGLRVVEFSAEARRLGVTVEKVNQSFEKDLKNGKMVGVISPSKTEAITYSPAEIEALVAEASSGKISLVYLSDRLNLSTYQVHTLLRHLLKTGKIDGELTYSTFCARTAFKKEMLQKSKAYKREHRLSVRNRQLGQTLKSP